MERFYSVLSDIKNVISPSEICIQESSVKKSIFKGMSKESTTEEWIRGALKGLLANVVGFGVVEGWAKLLD